MSIGASFTPFTPKKFEAPKAPPPPPVDKVAEGLKKHLGITEEEDIKSTKSLLDEVKKSRSENTGKISMELFLKIGELKCC